LFVGLRENKKGKMVVNSAFIDADLSSVMENRHSKIFVTYETFERIKLRDGTIDQYEAYLGSIDANYKTSLDVKDREKADSKKAGIKDVLSSKTGSTPFLEDLGVDSLVVDEAHMLKNSSEVFNFKKAKFLSISDMAKRGIDAQCKAWYIRGKSPRADGVLLLTATPITNSPLEIYSMLSLAKGHDKVNAMMLNINGADDFMNMMTDIVNEDDVTIDGLDRTTNVFSGLNNVDLLRRAIGQSSTIKTAEEVGEQVVLPDLEEKTANVALPDSTIERLRLYKDAFRWAIDDNSGRDENRGDPDAFQQVSDFFGESQKLIAQPFNLLKKMSALIDDPELDKRAIFFTIVAGNLEKAKTVIEAFNKKKIIEKRPRMAPFTEKDAVVGRKVTIDDETGDKVEMLSVEVRAMLQQDNKTIVIDTMSSVTQARFDELADKAELDLDVSIPPKLAALLENIQAEQAMPRGIDAEGNKSPIVKQIIFCDYLAMHGKIKRLLIKKAGFKSSHIAIITGKTNNTPDEIMAVQDGFNAHGEDNKYRIIIANEKGEVGINLQQGTQANHHLSIGWTPDSKIQRDGRSVRQGNKTVKVNVYTYDADGTFDTVKRDMVNKKGAWIDNVMRVGGDNKVEISGGLSDAQQEALIDVVGDVDAVSRIQESIAAKEAEARAKTNIAKQKVNIDTITKQREFIDNNDPVTDFIIPKITSLYVLQGQIKAIQTRIDNPKSTATAVFKNQAILSEIQAKERSISDQLARSVIITQYTGWGSNQTGSVITAEQAIKGYLGNYGGERGGKHSAQDLAKNLGSTSSYKIEVIDGSEIHTDWVAELAMAQSMIDTALSNFNQQAKQAGGLPAEVGKAFAEGKGLTHNSEPITVGSFMRSGDKFAIVTKDETLQAIHNTSVLQVGMPPRVDTPFILPGSSDYEACLIESAKLEDESGLNTYSEIVPEVAQYRTTARVKEYRNDSFELPHPYFPKVFSESKIKDNALLQTIYDDQNKIVLSRSDYSFKVSFETEVISFKGLFNEALVAYAKGKNKQLPWNMDSDYWFADALKKGIMPIFGLSGVGREVSLFVDELKELLLDKMDIPEISNIFVDFIKSKVSFIDFTGATSNDVKQLVPYDIGYIYTKAKNDAERAAERAVSVEVKPELPAVLSEEDAAHLFGKDGGDPDDIVAIIGDTMRWKDEIKDVAKNYGEKFKWDGKNKAWNVKRKVWDRLLVTFPKTKDMLKIIPATIARL
jgi:hypothetical protein